MEMKLTVNPANRTAQPDAARRRIPMSVPQRKLEVPDISGYHLYWFLDSNVPRAQQGGYEFVDEKEVPLNQFGVGTNKSISGNADLGSHIRVVAGMAENGSAEHLNLMKIREDWWKEDQKLLENRNSSVMSAIFQDEEIAGGKSEDRGIAYVKKALLNRPVRKGTR